MRNIFIGVGCISVLLSVPAFAATNVDVLKALYTAGTAPAATTDFPVIDYTTHQVLVSTNRSCDILDEGGHPYFYDVANVSRSTPAAGPLIPGKADEQLVFGDYTQSYDYTAVPNTVGADLVLTNPIYRSWTDGSNGAVHFVSAQLFARKSGNYIAFRVFIDHSNLPGFENEEYYGYCYTSATALF